jgi:phosphopantothenoylcysteine decarboxylase/phosphopantothenate--cysteine ligase
VGLGRMLEAEELARETFSLLGSRAEPAPLAGRRVLVTAGPTYEPIDTVRGITNLSSGKMGYAVAQAAVEAGASVVLVSGTTSLQAPRGVERIDVRSAREMHTQVMARAAEADVFVAVAAVADYHVVDAKPHKIKRGDGNMTVELAPNPDILAEVAALGNPPFCVGFAAETENLEENAQAKRRRKKLPLLAANLAQHAFGRDDNALKLFDDRGIHELPRAPKIVLARQLIKHLAAMLPERERRTARAKPA